MRLSIDTLLILARAGDREAEVTAVWSDSNRDAECWSHNGRIGAGWPGISDARKWTSSLQPRQG
jgi:hypothetical protein